MAIKRIDENPTIADQIVFDILTPFPNTLGNVDECFNANPYVVDNVVIYFLERDFASTNFGEYDSKIVNSTVQEQLDAAKKEACANPNPTVDQLNKIIELNQAVIKNTTTNKVYYKDAVPVATFGTPDFPAWLSTDTTNALITNIPTDASGNPQYGHFKLEWNPVGQREGDYFICWTYTPNPAGDSISKHNYFYLGGSGKVTTAIPTHITVPNKYETLLDRYTPEVFKMKFVENDLTPEVFQEYNMATAKFFTLLEDLSNQIIDLLDANAVQEPILPLLAAHFGVKLRSNDPTLWRRQIKNAIPLFKKKGTSDGLKMALAQAGINLKKLTRYWQIVSQYTWQEAFEAQEDGQTEFMLSKEAVLPVDILNTEVFWRGANDPEWTQLTTDYVELGSVTNLGCDGKRTSLTWLGGNLSFGPIILKQGDWIRVIYKVKEVPNLTQQNIEEYIRTLSLADQRDERNQIFPLKNWNVRVLEEDDPLFDILIPNRHPFHDPVIFGRVRTEFAYSENVYNMEEYNGSTRDSTDPCDIDRTFIDPCGACLGSKFSLDLEIEQLSNDRISEAREIVKEYSPFHAVLHSLNLSGAVNEIVRPPVEDITALITYDFEEFAICNGEMIFNRSMNYADQLRRNALTNATVPITGASATAYNTAINLYSPDYGLEKIGIDPNPALTVLEVMAPSANAGTYEVQNPSSHHVEIVTPIPTEPVDESAFTFRLSMEKVQKASSNIYQDNIKTFKDDNVNLGNYQIKSQWDVDNDPSYTGGAWKIMVGITSHNILNVLPNGTLELDDPTNVLPNVSTTGITYTLLTDTATVVTAGTTGHLLVKARAIVEMTGTILVRGASAIVDDLRNVMSAGDYAKIGSNQYRVTGFVPGQTRQFYIEGYNLGDVTGTSITVYRRLIDNAVGSFHYSGLKLITATNEEVNLNIQNGDNPPVVPLENNSFKENYLFLIGSKYYAIAEINGTNITLSGPMQTWTTAGTPVTYDVNKFSKVSVVIPDRDRPPMPGYEFEFIDRRGNDVVERQIEIVSPVMMASVLNAGNDQIVESINQKESVSFTIEYDDGTVQEGKI